MPTPELLARYLAGEATPDEVERILVWQQGEQRAPVDVEAALLRVHQKMDVVPIELHRARRIPRLYIGLMTAAALAAVALISVLQQTDSTPTNAPVIAAQTIRTAVGQRDSVTLPDGSRILIGPSSEITIAASGRAATVTGEAYLHVVHNEQHPFVVHTAAGVIRDLGTTFSVRAHGAAVTVTVNEGQVQLRSQLTGDAGVVLNPGDRGYVTEGAGALAQRAVVTAHDAAGWDRGALVFRNAPIAEVQDAIQRWYGVELRTNGASLKGRHLTATFEREPIEDVIQVIALALGATVDRRANVYMLQSRTQ